MQTVDRFQHKFVVQTNLVHKVFLQSESGEEGAAAIYEQLFEGNQFSICPIITLDGLFGQSGECPYVFKSLMKRLLSDSRLKERLVLSNCSYSKILLQVFGY
mmetsp:Transcript_9300/g.15671  ORF Transcript_9300/g.15671 Transcript_9300/m.15671 type:complete len:102 (-) Transcript_9300:308-613(-)